jgi:acyl carrier protein
MSDVAERVTKIIAEHLGVDAVDVKRNANVVEDLDADSLDTIELAMAFEEEFEITISDRTALAIQTVGDAIDLVEKSIPVAAKH